MRIDLSKVDDQSTWIRVGGETYSLRLYEFRGMMYYDVKKNDEYIIAGNRVLPWSWMLPYEFIAQAGNFRFESGRNDRKEYPWYERFNDMFWLVYYTNDEIASLEQ